MGEFVGFFQPMLFLVLLQLGLVSLQWLWKKFGRRKKDPKQVGSVSLLPRPHAHCSRLQFTFCRLMAAPLLEALSWITRSILGRPASAFVRYSA